MATGVHLPLPIRVLALPEALPLLQSADDQILAKVCKGNSNCVQNRSNVFIVAHRISLIRDGLPGSYP